MGESKPEEFQSDKSTQFGLRLTLPGCEANKRNGFALLAEEAEWSGCSSNSYKLRSTARSWRRWLGAATSSRQPSKHQPEVRPKPKVATNCVL